MVPVSDKLFHLQILGAAVQYGNSIALTDAHTGENLTFNQLRNKSYSFANALKLLGAKKGDIVGVYLENCYQYAIIFLGSALIGCSISGINPESTQHELERYLKLTNAKFLVVSSDNYHIAVNFMAQCELIIVDRQYDQVGCDFNNVIKKLEQNYLVEASEHVTLDDTLLTPFSSGTSGPPKCVQLTHRNFNFSTAMLKKALFNKLSGGRGRVTVGVLPFYHGSGFWALCFCLLEGHQTVVMGRFHPALMLNCIEEHKIDTLNVVPAIIGSLCQDEIQIKRWDLSSVTTVLCGSAPLGKKLSKRFLRKFPHVINLIQGYGMTEVVVLSHITPLGTPIDDERYLGSCGKLLPGFEAKLLDEETGAVQNEPWKRGELLLRSDAVMKGYLNDEEETKKVIDSNKWLHTGDVVYFDSDGFYFVVDRKKDLIKVNGMQVSPAELEDVLKSHKNVADAGVVGIPDEEHGQIPRAFVMLVNDTAAGSQPLDLIKYVNDRVAPHKQLRGGIKIVHSLPKTASGKTSRKDLLRIDFNSL